MQQIPHKYKFSIILYINQWVRQENKHYKKCYEPIVRYLVKNGGTEQTSLSEHLVMTEMIKWLMEWTTGLTPLHAVFS